MVSPSQYEWLTEFDELNLDDTGERSLRSRLRKRIREGISDFCTLFEHLPEQDRAQLLEATESGDGSQRVEELTDVHAGVGCLLALLYEVTEVGPGNSFESHLENAMHRVAERNGWLLDEFEFKVEFEKEADLEEKHDRFDRGDATVQEATVLLQRGRIDTDQFAEYVDSRIGPD